MTLQQRNNSCKHATLLTRNNKAYATAKQQFLLCTLQLILARDTVSQPAGQQDFKKARRSWWFDDTVICANW